MAEKEITSKKVTPLEVICPTCVASRGERCSDGIIGVFEVGFHKARIAEAARMTKCVALIGNRPPTAAEIEYGKSLEAKLPAVEDRSGQDDLCDVCHQPLEWPAGDPTDTMITSICRHTIKRADAPLPATEGQPEFAASAEFDPKMLVLVPRWATPEMLAPFGDLKEHYARVWALFIKTWDDAQKEAEDLHEKLADIPAPIKPTLPATATEGQPQPSGESHSLAVALEVMKDALVHYSNYENLIGSCAYIGSKCGLNAGDENVGDRAMQALNHPDVKAVTGSAAPALPATGVAAFFGTWPGDETDAQLQGSLAAQRKPATGGRISERKLDYALRQLAELRADETPSQIVIRHLRAALSQAQAKVEELTAQIERLTNG